MQFEAPVYNPEGVETFKKDIIENGELYIGMVDDKIAVIYVINCYCGVEYKNCDWQYSHADYRILHRLCVHPDFQNMGICKMTMEHIETELYKTWVEAIRLDAFSKIHMH